MQEGLNHGGCGAHSIDGSLFQGGKLRRLSVSCCAGYPFTPSRKVFEKHPLLQGLGNLVYKLVLTSSGHIWEELQLGGPSQGEPRSTQHLNALVPKTIRLMAFGTRVLEYWVLGPSGLVLIG